jgi:hypothetical protein
MYGCVGDVFFFHGGVHEEALGWVPPSKHHPDGYRAESVQSWCHGLAEFHHDEISSFLATTPHPEDITDRTLPLPFVAEGGYRHSDPGSRLMQYGMGNLPDGSTNPTICYDNFLVNGAPAAPSETVISFLNKSEVVRTITGHQPHGDVPVVISTPTLQVLTADTSYAQNVERDLGHFSESAMLFEELIAQRGDVADVKAAETRGHAVSEIVIDFDTNTAGDVFSKVLIHGLTQDLFAYEFWASADEFIGRSTAEEGGWWVKAQLQLLSRSDGGGGGGGSGSAVYLMSKSEGRRVLNAFVSGDSLKCLLVVPPASTTSSCCHVT